MKTDVFMTMHTNEHWWRAGGGRGGMNDDGRTDGGVSEVGRFADWMEEMMMIHRQDGVSGKPCRLKRGIGSGGGGGGFVVTCV